MLSFCALNASKPSSRALSLSPKPHLPFLCFYLIPLKVANLIVLMHAYQNQMCRILVSCILAQHANHTLKS